MKKSAKQTLVLILTGAILAAAFVVRFYGIELFFYEPWRGEGETPAASGVAFEDVYFSSADGTRLHGWFIPARGASKGAVLHVHGNTGNLSYVLPQVLWLAAAHYDVFTFDYRGYGLSDDRQPNPKALMEDTQSALRYLVARKEVDPARLYVIGQSLGGNNALAALAEGGFKVAAVVLDATFFSYPAIADDSFPGIGVLTDDRYSASRYVAHLTPTPVLILHGDADKLVPCHHAFSLYDAASPPKRLIVVPGLDHVQTLRQPEIQQTVLDFFTQAAAGTPPTGVEASLVAVAACKR